MGKDMKRRFRLANHLWLLPALAVLALIVSTIAFLWESVTDGMLWEAGGAVTRVYLDGPGARAGLQVGDVILSVDGCSMADWEGCRRPIYRPGDLSSVRFRRGEQIYETVLTLERASGSLRLARLMVPLVALAFSLVSLVTLLNRLHVTEARLFYLFCQAGAASLTLDVLWVSLVSFAGRWAATLNGLLMPMMIHFYAVFPERRWLARQRWPLWVFYGVGIAVAAMRWLRPVLSFPSWQSAQIIGYLWLLSGFIGATGLMVAAYITPHSPDARRRIRLIVFATVIGFGPIALLTTAPVALFGSTSPVEESWMFTIPLTSVIPIAYAVALWRHNLMGFDRALNRGLVYLLVGIVLFGMYFALLMLFHSLLPTDVAGRAALGAAAALFAALTFQPLQKWIQRLVDRLFYGGWYDYRGLVEKVGQALSCTLDAETLIEVLVHKVPRAMHLPGAALWLEREGRLEQVSARGEKGSAAPPGIGEDALCPQEEVIIRSDRAIVPLVVESRVVGAWVLAGRANGEWGPEDEDLLKALGHQASLAAQNVRLVAALRAKVTEVEGMHRRLLAAREEERADLARELHDGVIQDLVGLRYRLEAFQEKESGTGQAGEIYDQAGVLIDELRRLCSDLRPPALDQLGLAAALRALAREMTARGLPVGACLEDVMLSDEAAIGLYRIAQEALSNAWRHAEASHACLELARHKGRIELIVADDGRGFDPASVRGIGGRFGLLGMSERAEALGGQCKVESAPGEGTRVTVHL
jgi:signal transduction histidine kinase